MRNTYAFSRWLVLLLGLIYPAIGDRWLLVDFGPTDSSHAYGDKFPTWETVVKSSELVENYQHGVNPDLDGYLRKKAPPVDSLAYVGITGTVPIRLQRGHKIIATFYNPSNPTSLKASVSFQNPNSPKSATRQSAFYTMYRIGQARIQHQESVEYYFNITNEHTIVCPDALPTEGNSQVFNIHFNSPFVLTKIELSDEADTLAPLPPKNLKATFVALTQDATKTSVELTWTDAVDPPGNGGFSTGVSRYYIYRDNHFYDLLNYEWTTLKQGNLSYIDNAAIPGVTHTYQVTASDAALIGYYPTLDNIHTQRAYNESKPATIQVTVPDFESKQLVSPWDDLNYQGAFLLPKIDEYAYGGQGLAYYPKKSPTHLPNESEGSLFVVGHDHRLNIAEISIPEPIAGSTPEGLNIARELKPMTAPWPAVYGNGNWIMDGSVAKRIGLGYHPGVAGDFEGLIYGLYMAYSGDIAAPAIGLLSTDLQKVQGPWHAGGLPKSPSHEPFYNVAKFFLSAPQPFADTHFGGQSLLMGLGWPISGHGWPSAGPTLFTSAPWKDNTTFANGYITVKKVLGYGSTGEEAKWMNNWNENVGFEGAAWIDAGRQAVVIAGHRTRGEEWYGGENGYASNYCDGDIPRNYGKASTKAQNTTEKVPCLFFYSPEDLARASKGLLQPWKIQPYAVLDVKDFMFTKKSAYAYIKGMAYSANLKKLFIYESHGGGSYGKGAIHVWDVAETNYEPVSLNSEQKGAGIGNFKLAFNRFTQQFTVSSLSKNGPATFKLFDLNGKRILQKALASGKVEHLVQAPTSIVKGSARTYLAVIETNPGTTLSWKLVLP